MVDDALSAPDNEGRAPFMEHIKELRNRILYSAISIGLGLGVGMIFGNQIIEILKKPAGNIHLVTLDAGRAGQRLYQGQPDRRGHLRHALPGLPALAFVAPGLTPREKTLRLHRPARPSPSCSWRAWPSPTSWPCRHPFTSYITSTAPSPTHCPPSPTISISSPVSSSSSAWLSKRL